MSCHAECLELGMLTQMLLLSFEIRDIISTILCCVVDTLKTYLMMFNFENLKTKMICVSFVQDKLPLRNPINLFPETLHLV